ncbi:hypothetical protein B5X24_HaOG207071 [Helicoverpa armigera]|uniref:Uncharacterized protein n=1 Tax=Helicoverpa armigera TaxID=29058 RepID=A0A2W1BMN2_HELAM|nr:hypothetical protein B5X24_HaOG207071 [Helicoverpa armigera]
MADPSRGRGRGLALLQALKKSQAMESSDEASPNSTPGPSTAPSVATSAEPQSLVSGTSSMLSGATSIGGRGKIAAMLLAKAQQKPGGPVFSPASDTSSMLSGATSIGGRGKIAAMLLAKAQQKPGGPVFSPASDVSPSLPKSAGRGLKLLQSLQASKAAGDAAKAVERVTEKMAEASVSVSKPPGDERTRKPFREVSDAPPVVRTGTSGTPVEVTANFIYLNVEENNAYEYEVRYDPEQDFKNLRFKLLSEHRQYFKDKSFDGTTLYVPHKLPEEALNLVSTNPFDNSKVKITDLQLVRIGRNHFNEKAGIPIPQHRLEVWPGYVTAVDEYQGGLMLTLDSTHKVLRTQSVLSFIKETVQAEGAGWKKAMAERLVGCSVMTTYNKKMFRVDSIDDTKSPRSTFEKEENGKKVQVSYINYYKDNYGIEIKDYDQPLLISRDSKLMSGSEKKIDFMICLVPELCQLTGLTDDQRSNFKLMKDVAAHTKITPNQRHAAFKKYIEAVMNNETARSRLAGWGLSIAPETINLTARTLQPETLYFGNNVKVPGKPNAEWNAEVTRNHVIQAIDIVKWVVLYTDRDKQVARDFLETMKRSCRPMGINVAEPEMIRLPNDRTDSYVLTLKKVITSDLQIVVAICPSARDDRYGAIKKICCADNPIPSQVINARTLMNQNKIRSITQKILLQMNCKIGGTLWNINIPFKSAMVIGIDSHHDASRKKQSVCAFVASYNQALTHWYSRVVFQSKGQEVVDSLKECFVDSLKHYIKVNSQLPERIIIYRDGVGDGEFKVIQKFEIPQMEICLSLFEGEYKPRLTYIVLILKLLYSRYDFLIVSQKVNQGTVTPTHYVVLHDSSDMTPDQCQRITYKMCHLYYNWPGTVRVPAPCQYAHKLAYLVGNSIHQTPSAVLQDKLFFL